MTMTPPVLQQHARELAAAFKVRLIESDQLQPEEAMGISRLRVALVSPIIDETTYAVALHEIGHLASPTGIIRHVATGTLENLLVIEEEAAWAWAAHYAREWTPLMAAVATYTLGTYQAAQKAHEAAAPPAPRQRIDWNQWPSRGATTK